MANGPILSWGTTISTIGLATVLFGGQWALTQQGLNSLAAQLAAFKVEEQNRHIELNRLLEIIRQEYVSRDTWMRELKARDEKWADQERHNQQFVTKGELHGLTRLRDNQYEAQQRINQQVIDAYVTVKAYEAAARERERIMNDVLRRLETLEKERR